MCALSLLQNIIVSFNVLYYIFPYKSMCFYTQKSGNPLRTCHFQKILHLIHNLEHIELQIIGFVRRPENRMIRCLGAEFHLTQTLVDAVSRLSDCLGKQLIRHKMGAGTGCKKSTIFHKLHGTKINLAIAFDGIFNRISGLGKCRWV